RDIIPIGPSDFRPGCNRDLRRRKREVVDVYFRVVRLRGVNGAAPQKDRAQQCASQHEGASLHDVVSIAGWDQVARVVSTIARCVPPRTCRTLVTPRTERSFPGGRSLIGPGLGAVPGAGCGNAVDRAVRNATLPSTFCMT